MFLSHHTSMGTASVVISTPTGPQSSDAGEILIEFQSVYDLLTNTGFFLPAEQILTALTGSKEAQRQRNQGESEQCEHFSGWFPFIISQFPSLKVLNQ